MWKILQQKKADDYVIATGKQYSVKSFINLVAKELKMKITWKGKGINEKGYWGNKQIISIDKKYLRPTEVESLLGDAAKARKQLDWKPIHNINLLVKDMVSNELKKINGK
jgi:GDPmannose 4,6-dehydratase